MKYFTKQVNERLKLSKDSKVINNLSILDIKKETLYKCIPINLKNYKYFLDNDRNPLIKDWVPLNDPKKINTNEYELEFYWDDYKTHGFKCYHIQSIHFPFLWFIYESKVTPLYIIFADDKSINEFIENYNDLYKDMIIDVKKKIDEYYETT